MYILTFKTSRSKYFQEGLEMARKLGGSWDGKTMVLEIPADRLLNAYDRLLPLFEIVGNWSSLKATYKGKKVDPYRFILVMHFLKECAGMRKKEPMHCWLNLEEQGWGCKRISNVMYQLGGNGVYEWNEKYWYNFGRFNDKNEWIIDKERIYQRLNGFAEDKGLTVCPFFRAGYLKESVDRLPDKIVPDEESFRLFYEEEFYKGKKIRVPVNIRHIPESGGKDAQEAGKYDPGAIIPVNHDGIRKQKKEPEGERFWNKFSKN
jgi:hypothetical protein